MSPVVHISRLGNLGNQMFQYMVAKSIETLVPGCIVSGEDMNAWGISLPYVTQENRRVAVVTSQRVEVERLASDLREGRIDYVELRTYGQHFANMLPSAQQYDKIFSRRYASHGGAEDELVINIRAGDILEAVHSDYTLLPVAYYREIVDQMGLKPVFCGQTTMNNAYLHRLGAAFPEARFLPDPGPLETFDYMRNSRHVLPSISTFAWLAAWLSSAATVILPVYGLFNPLQCRTQNFVPLGDPRYRFDLFPASYAVPLAKLDETHWRMGAAWRRMTHDVLRCYMNSPPRIPARPEAVLNFFDEDFYRASYPDVDQSIAGGHIPSGRHHYEHNGRAEGRKPFAFDPAWYVAAYPMAGLEIGQGDYLDPLQHYVDVGAARGYGRVPEISSDPAWHPK